MRIIRRIISRPNSRLTWRKSPSIIIAPQGYHDFIGFEVSKTLLERAFLKTYGVPLKDVAIDRRSFAGELTGIRLRA